MKRISTHPGHGVYMPFRTRAFFSGLFLSMLASFGLLAQPTLGVTEFGNTYQAVLPSGPNLTPSASHSGFTFVVRANMGTSAPVMEINTGTTSSNGTDAAFQINDDGNLNSIVTELSVKSSDGSEFSLNSFEFGMLSTADQTVSLTAYKDNSPTGGSQIINVRVDGSYQYSNYLILSGVSGFDDIDEIRLQTSNSSSTNYFEFDAFDIGSPVVSAPTTCTPATGVNDFTGASTSLASYGPGPVSGMADCWEFTATGMGSGSMYWNGSASPSNINIVMQSATDISIKSSDGSEFDLNSFTSRWYSFVGSYSISGYRDGSLVATATGNASSSWTLTDLTSNSQFNNVDEILLSGFASSNVTFQLDKINISAASTNTAPTSTNFTASINPGEVYTFATADFSYSDNDSDPLAHLQIDGVPVHGILWVDANGNNQLDCNESILANNDLVSKSDLDAGYLKYFTTSTVPTSFIFMVNDGVDYSTPTNVASLNPDTAGVRVVDFESSGLADNTDFGADNLTSGNFKFTYSAGNLFGDGDDGAEGSMGLYLAYVSGPGETLTIESTDGSEFDLRGFFATIASFDPSGQLGVEAFKNAASVYTGTIDVCGAYSGGKKNYIALGPDFDDVDKVVITSGSYGFIDVFDDFVFVPGAPSAGGPTPDTQAPVAFCQDASLYLDASGQATLAASAVDGGSYDPGSYVKYGQSSATYYLKGVASGRGLGDSLGYVGSTTEEVTFTYEAATDDKVRIGDSVNIQYWGAHISFHTRYVIWRGTGSDPADVTWEFSSYPRYPLGYSKFLLEQENATTGDLLDPTRSFYIKAGFLVNGDTAYLDPSGMLVPKASRKAFELEVVTGQIRDKSQVNLGLSKTSFNCSDIGAQSLVLTVTDSTGNSSTCTANVTVMDTISPVVQSRDLTVYLDSIGKAAITVSDVDSATQDACGLQSIELNPVDILAEFEPNHRLSGILVDNYNKAAQVFTSNITTSDFQLIMDLGACKFNGPAGAQVDVVSLTAGGQPDASNVLGTAYASDTSIVAWPGCSTRIYGKVAFEFNNVNLQAGIQYALVFRISPDSDPRGGYNILRSSSPDDPNNPYAGGSFWQYDWLMGMWSESSSIDLNFKITAQTHKSDFECADVGAQQVVLMATDVNGNQAQELTTIEVKDTISPVVNLRNVTAYLHASGNATISAADADSATSDACGIDTLLLSQYSFNCSMLGSNLVNFTARDVNGNTSSASFSVSVLDTVSPMARSQNISVYLDVNGNASITAADVDNGSSDACGIDTLVLDTYNFTCAEVGANPVNLTATDLNGNSGTTTASVTVIDTISPVVQVQDITVYLDQSGMISFTANDIDNGSSDACGIDRLILDNYQFGCAEVGANTVLLSAADVNGNTSSASATLTVIDTISPVLAVRNVTAYLDASGNASINSTFVDNGTADACGIDTLLLSQYDFNCAHIGANSIIFTAEDINGNTASTSVSVNVLDTISPVVHSQNIAVYLDVNGNASITATDLDNGSSDACGIDTLVLDTYNFTCAEVGANALSLTATDVNGNSSSATATLTVIDTISPAVQVQDITVYLNQNGVATASALSVDNATSDACGIQSRTLSQTSFSCADRGANLLTFTAEDVNGNTASASVRVTVEDTIAPLAKAKNLLVYLDNNGEAVITPAMADNASSDNCGFKLSLSQSLYGCADKGLNLESLTATDSTGNSSTANFLIEVRDTTSPSLVTRNITVQLGATGQASIAASQLDGGSYDNCTNQLFFAASKTSFSCADLGVNTVAITITDGEGNSTTGTATVIVEDNIKPVAQAQNLTLQLDANGMAAITPAMINSGSSDNCSIDSMWVSQEQFSCADLGSNSLQFSVMDQSGNIHTTNFVVKVEDNAVPVVATQNITVQLNASGQAVITTAMIDNGSMDNCSISSLTLSQTNFSCADLGTQTVTLTAIDQSGNNASATATVTVEDTISPIVVTQNVTIQLDANGQASVNTAMIDNGSSDNCSISSLTLSQTNFTCADLGTNTVSLTAVDQSGNTSSATATVKVEDNAAPVMATQNITVQLDANGQASINAAMIDNGTTDNCSIISLVLDKTSFSCADLGVNTVTLTATDQSGNADSATASVTVEDNLSPVVATQNITVQLDANGQAVITTAMIDNGSMDNCSISSLTLSQTNFSCADLGTQTVTLTAIDQSGNNASATATVTVEDTISPIVVTQNVTIQLDANGQASVNTAMIDNGSSDNCSISSLSLDITSFDCSNVGTPVTVTLTAVDQSSNSASATAVVTVEDHVAPVAQVQNITVYLDASGNRVVQSSEIDNGSYDNCGSITTSLDVSSFDCADLGQNLVTFTATDANGNSSQKTAFVTVIDSILPSIDNLPNTITAYAQSNQCAAPVQWPSITGSDNCSGASVTTTKANGGLFNIGTTRVLVNVVDGSGNSITDSFDVMVVDTVSPMISGVPSSFNITPSTTSCGALVTWNAPVATDNCAGVSITSSHTPGSSFPIGNTVVTYTATDAYNNTSSVSFTVTVNDVIAPTIASLPSDITQAADAGQCGAVVNFAMPVVTDNCSGASISSSHMPGSTFPTGTTVVNFTATDAAGNLSTASFSITVEDLEAPEVSSVPTSDTIGVCNAVYTFAMPAATDNCGSVSITQLSGLPSGSIFPTGVTQNSFRISDQFGNDTVVSFSIVVVPQAQPVLPSLMEICENAEAVELNQGQNMIWSGNGIVNGTVFDPSIAGSGRHQLMYTFTDSMGCDVSGNISVSVSPLPASPEIIQVGSTSLGTKASYVTYQWYRNGVAIPGATQPTYDYVEAGNYQVVVGNAFGCEVYGEGYVVYTNGGGIGIEEFRLEDLSLYPNPSNGDVSMDLNAEGAQDLSVSIFSVEGKKLFEQEYHSELNGLIQLDLHHLPDATYFLYIRSRGEVEVRKLILY